MVLEGIPNAIGENTATAAASSLNLLGHPFALGAGILFIIITIVIILQVKKILINSILGLVAWGLLTYVYQVQLPFWASLVISAIFGLAGIGTMLVLRYFGLL